MSDLPLALNKLDGMAITNYTLLNETNFNIGGKVLIPNPTVVTIEMVGDFINCIFLPLTSFRAMSYSILA